MTKNEDVPSGTWRWLGGAAVFMLVVAIGGISLISAGTFDPPINGALQSTLQLTPQTVAAGSASLNWLDITAPEDDYSLRLRARANEDFTDVGYGLAVGNAERRVIVAVSPHGYVTVRVDDEMEELYSGDLTRSNTQEPNLPWQTWPHVRTGSQSNEIWIDVNDGEISGVRINRELLATRPLPVEGGRVGLWATAFSEESTVEFLELEIFYQDAP